MTEVISVRFKNKGKVYYFDPSGIAVSAGDKVIVETAKGLEFAECVGGNHQVDDANVRAPLRPVIRIATPEDVSVAEENRRREAEAFRVCKEKIKKHELDMKLVDVEYNFEGNKILFFFTSEGRVDFRELVKDLAGVFKTRIELRQIGVRDEARMIGGLGICGKPFCCAQFLDDFEPVSIKMAKTQGLSLNPTKISGTCGRLMCCLKYEQEAYEDLVKNVPKVDSFVDTPEGKGSVMDVNLLKGTVRVRLEDPIEMTIRTYGAEEVTVLGGKAKRAEYLAMKAEGKIQEQRPAPKLRKPAPAPAPAPVVEEPKAEAPKEPAGEQKKRSRSRNRRPQQPKQEGAKNNNQQKAPQNQHKPNQQPQKQAQTPKQEGAPAAQKPNNRHYRHHRRKPGGGQQKPSGE